MAKKNEMGLEDTNIEMQTKDELLAMSENEIQNEFDKLSLVDIEDMLKGLNRMFFYSDNINMTVTTENLNGSRNSFLRRLTDRIEQAQEEILVAKKDVKQISGVDKSGRDSRKAIAWVKTLEARYFKLFDHISAPAFGRISKTTEAEIESYKNLLKEEIVEQIALLKSDIEALEAEAKILKHNNNTLRFSNRNTSVISEKEDIFERSMESLNRLTAIENSGGEIDKVNAEIAELEENLNILNNKSSNEIKLGMQKDLEEIKLRLLLSFVANFGITDDLNIIKEIASNAGKAYDLEELAKKYYITYLDQQAYEGVLDIERFKPLYLEEMIKEISGYDGKHKTLLNVKTALNIEWATEAARVAVESAKSAFENEFTTDKISKLVAVTNLPDDYYTTEIDSSFLNLHGDKFKANDLVNLENCINVFNKKIRKVVKNSETRLQIKRLDSRIYDAHKNLYTDIIFWYQQALIPINNLFGTEYELDFTDMNQIEMQLDNLRKEFEKAEKDIAKIIVALNETKTTMRNNVKGFEEEIERYLSEARDILGELFKVVPVRVESDNAPVSVNQDVAVEEVMEETEIAPIEPVMETLLFDENQTNQ